MTASAQVTHIVAETRLVEATGVDFAYLAVLADQQTSSPCG